MQIYDFDPEGKDQPLKLVNRPENLLCRHWKLADSENMRVCNLARDVKALFKLKVK